MTRSLLLLAILVVAPALHAAHAVLDDIHVLRDYRAGKNSYVEATDRHAGVWTHKGFRYTLLNAQGSGSLRHIWTTWFPDGPYFEWQFFVDGEKEPSIRGPIEKLIAASRDVAAPTPAPWVDYNPAKRDFNFFLPVPFAKSLRVDVVQQTDKVGLFFAQLDYRTGDDSLHGVRLRMENGVFRYAGFLAAARPAITTAPTRFERKTVGPGERTLLATMRGPAIVRRLRLNAPNDMNLRLKVRYDGANGFAIDAPVARLFGEFRGVSFEPGTLHLPMPFRDRCEVYLENTGVDPIQASLEADIEKATRFDSRWGHLHAFYWKSARTTGYKPHPVLYVRGRGHWLGMSLFRTGHDHGGGDFAVIDGESETPAFLHGVNGEDYFTFAWFGSGKHMPYAEAISNDRGRYRHHFENPYPFQHSIAIEWGAFPNLQPESVAVWYQDSPEDTTVAPGDPRITDTWDVFGPAPIGGLPSVADLDAGKKFTAANEGESFESGWMREESTGPSLNLTYISRHGALVPGEKFLGGNGHAYLARKQFTAKQTQTVWGYFSHDDPVEIELNGKVVYTEKRQLPGFQTKWVFLPIRAGSNQLVVRLTNYFNQNFNWAGFGLWLKNANGQALDWSSL